MLNPAHPCTFQHQRTPAARLTLGACAALLAGGCGYESPTIEVKSATAVESTDQHTVVNFVIEATNPNAISLPLRRLDYTVAVAGTPFSGVRSPEATLPPGGTRTITFPAVLPAGTAAGAYTLSGTLLYITPGRFAEILFDTGVSRPTVGFAGQGEIGQK
ncbi:MAG: LEA type 2 family protein [Phycisphaerales bacterium]